MSNIKNLISVQFENYIERYYSNFRNKGILFLITKRNHNVYLDIKSGLEFSQIEYHRLVSFHLYLQAYLCFNTDDNINKLYIELKKFLEIK